MSIADDTWYVSGQWCQLSCKIQPIRINLAGSPCPNQCQSGANQPDPRAQCRHFDCRLGVPDKVGGETLGAVERITEIAKPLRALDTLAIVGAWRGNRGTTHPTNLSWLV